MRVCGLIVLGVLVLVTCLGHQNEVSSSPVPDPCNYIFHHRKFPAPTPPPTEPPKSEEEMIVESKKEKVKQFETLLQEIMSWGSTEAVPPPPPPPPMEDQPRLTPNNMDMNQFFAAYIDFLTKFFKMF